MSKPLENKEFDKQCVWKTDGYQCQQDGHLSTGTRGEGPWYCRPHFARLMGWPTWEAAVTDESQSAIDARVNKLVPRRNGESEHDWSMRCRDWSIEQLSKPVHKSNVPRESGKNLTP